MCYFEAIFRGWDEIFCLSKPRTTEGPRTREARTREGILYFIYFPNNILGIRIQIDNDNIINKSSEPIVIRAYNY